jgi:hypothetical protein
VQSIRLVLLGVVIAVMHQKFTLLRLHHKFVILIFMELRVSNLISLRGTDAKKIQSQKEEIASLELHTKA